MKIIIDGRSIGYGTSSSVLISLLNGLNYSKHEYSVIGKKEIIEKLNLPIKIINDSSKNNGFSNYINPSLSKLINTYDIYFTPYYLIPKGITISSYCIFYDTSIYDGYIKDRKIKKRFNYSYRVADKIFTFSEFTKKRIESIFGKHKEINVLNMPLEFSYKKNNSKSSEEYFLCLGRFKSYKHIDMIIDSIKKRNKKISLHIIVIKEKLTGKDKKIIKQYKDDPLIKIYDSLNREEYIEQIKNAKALIDASSYSGVSSPIYDAIKYNVPVICSDIESHKELYSNNNVTFFKDQDQKSLEEIINNDEFNKTVYDNKFKETHNPKIIYSKIISKFEKNKNQIKTKRNFIFNLIYQVLVVLTPLITTPYISRILGADNIGKFSFAFTLTYYFVIIGYLGFSQYAQRAIAEVQNDKEEQSRVFWQIVIIRLLPVLIALGILTLLNLLNVFGDYSLYVTILSILVIGVAFDITFYFHGKENYFSVMLINLVIRLVFLICIFVFVKTRNDTWLYTLFYALMVVGSYISMWFALPVNLRKVKLKTLNFKKHMQQSLFLFLPVAAISIYAILDKTLIGVLMHGQVYHKVGYITVIANISDLENGFYYQAERIIRAILSIILAFGVVMSSRNTIEYTSKHIGSVKKNIYGSFRFVFAVGIPLALGTILIARSFVPLFFGTGYDKVADLLIIYSPIIIIVGISNVIGVQYLLPLKRDKQYTTAVLIGFALNLGFNCLLIPFLGSIGAVLGTLISETTIVIIESIYIRKEISLSVIISSIWKYLLAGAIMISLGFLVNYFILNQVKLKDLFDLLILVPFSAIIYFLTLLILKDKYLFIYAKLVLYKIKVMIIFLKTSIINDIVIENVLKVGNKIVNVKDKVIFTIKGEDRNGDQNNIE